MPTVPTYSRPQVATAPLPGVGFDTGAPAAAFERPASAPDLSPAIALAQREQAKADQVAVNTAQVQAHGLKLQAEQAALAMRGTDALGARSAADGIWSKGVGQISSALPERIRHLFDARALGMYEDLSSTVERHAHQEFLAHDEAQTTALLDMARTDAVQHIGDPEQLALSIAKTKATVADFGKRNGWSPEQLADTQAKQVSKLHLSVVEQMLAAPDGAGGGDRRASAYLAQHGAELVAADTVQASRLVEHGSTEGEAQRASDGIVASSADLLSALKQTAAIQDPKVREAAEHRVRQHYADLAAGDREAQSKAFHEASSIIEANGGNFSAVPVRLRVLMSPEENGALQHRADQIRNPARVTNPDIYTSLINAAGLNEATRAWFRDLPLGSYRNQLSEQDFDHVLGLQLQLRSQTMGGEAAEARRQAAASDRDAKKQQQREAARQLLEGAGIHLPPTVPGGPISRAPGTPPASTGQTPVVRAVPGKGVPQSWIDHAARDPNYRAYLTHMGVIQVDAPATVAPRPASTGNVDLRQP